MILVNTNKSRNAKQTIEAVMRLKDSDFDTFSTIMKSIGDTTTSVLSFYTDFP
jgi:predicted transcriptional regulator